MGGRFPFSLAGALEALLLVLAVALAWMLGIPLWTSLRWDFLALGSGLLGVIPLVLPFWWVLRSNASWIVGIRQVLEEVVRPLMESWTNGQLLAISVIAGVGEEALFRGVLQGGLAAYVGEVPALMIASVVFGLFHPMSRGYMILATAIGVYLGGLWLWTDNLLVPMVTHAAYDFGALMVLLRGRSGLTKDPP